ncbi:MAG: hypothetical protein K6B46_00230 [Opitutales bacterium]|nr:hypothetical protein [Opitutales bacterium]
MKIRQFSAALLCSGLFGVPATASSALDFFNNFWDGAHMRSGTQFSQSVPASIGDGGKISKTSAGIDLELVSVSPSERFLTVCDLSYRRNHYHFSGVPAAFKAIDEFSVFAWQELIYDKDNGRAVAGLLSLRSATADTTDFSHGLGASFGIGFKQYFSRDEFVWLGMTATYSQLRQRMYYWPALSVNWNLRDDLKLSLSNGAELTWAVDSQKRCLLHGKISYQPKEFQVQKNIGWQETAVPVDFSLEYRFSEHFYAIGTFSLLTWQYYRRWDKGHRRNSTKFTAEPTVAFGIEMGCRF